MERYYVFKKSMKQRKRINTNLQIAKLSACANITDTETEQIKQAQALNQILHRERKKLAQLDDDLRSKTAREQCARGMRIKAACNSSELKEGAR